MTACGQTNTHLPHWIQTSGSQTGTSAAKFRFSHCVVPVGNVPSYGNALTGHAIAATGDDSPKHVAHKLRRVAESPVFGFRFC